MSGLFRSRWTGITVLAGAILVVSVVPIPGAVPDESGGLPTSLLFHAVGYAALAMTLRISLIATRRPHTNAGALLGASAYGALIECLQYPLPYRTFSYLDMLINATGAGLGLALLWVGLALREAP